MREFPANVRMQRESIQLMTAMTDGAVLATEANILNQLVNALMSALRRYPEHEDIQTNGFGILLNVLEEMVMERREEENDARIHQIVPILMSAMERYPNSEGIQNACRDFCIPGICSYMSGRIYDETEQIKGLDLLASLGNRDGYEIFMEYDGAVASAVAAAMVRYPENGQMQRTGIRNFAAFTSACCFE